MPPNAPTRLDRKRERARLDILDTAESLLVDRGVEGVTLAAIGELLGQTKQAIYHYFPSKSAVVQQLALKLIDDEARYVRAALDAAPDAPPLGILIQAVYDRYRPRMDLFRFVYGETQLKKHAAELLAERAVKNEVNVLTRELFQIVEDRLCTPGDSATARNRQRRLAFSAWIAALGLLTILSITEVNDDPLLHADADLVRTLQDTFNAAAA